MFGRGFKKNTFRLMEKAIFDTSVWIDFSKKIENEQTLKLENYLNNFPMLLYLTPTILQEFLMGLRHENDFFKFTIIR